MQRSLCDNVLNPELAKYLIYDNGASVKGKGVDFARRRMIEQLSKFLHKHSRNGYVLKIDFSKFFDNIPHDELLQKIEEKLSDDTAMPLIRHIADNFKIDVSYMTGEEYRFCLGAIFNLLEYNKLDRSRLTGEKFMRKSVGIGSQISQVAGIFYPTFVDNFFKIVKSCKYYERYMDDIIVFHEDKNFLASLLADIEPLARERGLFINKKKTQIIKLSHGFTFLQIKYNITETNKIIRRLSRETIARQRRKLKAKSRLVEQGILTKEQCATDYHSWRGTVKNFNNWHSIRNLDVLCDKLYGKYERGGNNDKRRTRTERDRASLSYSRHDGTGGKSGGF